MSYVEDNKVSHVDSKVLDNILETTKKSFGEITITRGKKHTFLGMNLQITEDKKTEIEMEEQLM